MRNSIKENVIVAFLLLVAFSINAQSNDNYGYEKPTRVGLEIHTSLSEYAVSNSGGRTTNFGAGAFIQGRFLKDTLAKGKLLWEIGLSYTKYSQDISELDRRYVALNSSNEPVTTSYSYTGEDDLSKLDLNLSVKYEFFNALRIEGGFFVGVPFAGNRTYTGSILPANDYSGEDLFYDGSIKGTGNTLDGLVGGTLVGISYRVTDNIEIFGRWTKGFAHLINGSDERDTNGNLPIGAEWNAQGLDSFTFGINYSFLNF